MPKKKIAILGGGMAGLSAAYHLTRTPELAAENDVTVYSLGWKLGGKCASWRDERDRNIEHGLHVWFGCYANTFAMAKEVYDQGNQPDGSPLQTIEDLAKPQDYTPIGVNTDDGWQYFPIDWPDNGGKPWDQNLMPTLLEMIETITGWLKNMLLERSDAELAATASPPAHSRARFQASAQNAFGEERFGTATALATEFAARGGAFHTMEILHHWAGALARLTFDHVVKDAEAFLELWHWLEQEAAQVLREKGRDDLHARMLYEALIIFTASVKGIFFDLILPNKPFVSLDDWDFRDWLIHHGADREIVGRSSFIRVIYDTLYQYLDGDVDRPSYAAGTCIGVIGRLIATYKGHALYELQSGFGEGVVSPLYTAMLKRGVKFELFSKVLGLELDASKTRIAKVRIGQQAKFKTGHYDPVFEHENLRFWPKEPFWDQLVDGDVLKAKGVNFESRWCNEPLAGETVLEADHDFDVVVLAIVMGAYKKLNDDPTLCDELTAASPRFHDFTAKIGIVPTQSVQLWFDETPAGLGWEKPKAAAVSGPEYLNIFADMTQVIGLEGAWAGGKPKTLYYLTGTYASTLYAEPAVQTGTLKAATDEVRTQTIAWLKEKSGAMWPKVSDGKSFNWSTLHAPAGAEGTARFDAQYLRANIDPTECCVLSTAGTTQFRLGPKDSGFANLILAGEATRQGFNTTSVEGAVMSGMAASRAICGEPQRVVGYDFLERKPWERPETTTGLPRYVPWIGHGAAELPAPAVFTGINAYLFLIEGDRAAMQATVDTLLDAAAIKLRHDVPVPFFLVSFMAIARCTSSVPPPVGWLPGRECAIWIPLVQRGNGLLPRPTLWAPYIFINYSIGLLTGRETWGWPKVLGTIEMAGDHPGERAAFTCRTTVFKTLAASTGGVPDAPLLRINGTRPIGTPGNSREAVKEIISRLFGALAAETYNLLPWHPLFATVVLKQFRDVAVQDRACYQALVDSPVKFSSFQGMGLLEDTFELEILNCESHQVLSDFTGQRPVGATMSLPVRHAFWAGFDFEALPGSVLEQRSRSQ